MAAAVAADDAEEEAEAAADTCECCSLGLKPAAKPAPRLPCPSRAAASAASARAARSTFCCWKGLRWVVVVDG